jgi:hypothetical protein
MTVVEFLEKELYERFHLSYLVLFDELINQAKEMEKEHKIEFACKVAEASAEKYIQGKTTEQIAKELLTLKSE